MGDGVTLVSSAEETAKDVYRTLVAEGLERADGLPEPQHRFLTTGDPAPFPTSAGGSWAPRPAASEQGGLSMRLTVVGCSGSFPGPGSPASCYLVEADGFRVLLDLGNGALGALQRHLQARDIDAVLLSHLHADHCIDLLRALRRPHLRPGPDLPAHPGLRAGRRGRPTSPGPTAAPTSPA